MRPSLSAASVSMKSRRESDMLLYLVLDFVYEFLEFVFLKTDSFVLEAFHDFAACVCSFFRSKEKTYGRTGNRTTNH